MSRLQFIAAIQGTKMTITGSWACATLLLAVTPPASGRSAESGPLVIMIDRVKDGFGYSVNSKAVPAERLLDDLGNAMLGPADRNRSVIVLLHEDAPLRLALNVRGILHKVGFARIKYYYYEGGKRKMAELGLETRAVPFSVTGDVVARPH